MIHVLETDRLLLREWRTADRAPFAALNADPEVRRYLGPPLTRGQSDEMVDRMQQSLEDRGWGLWCVEVRSDGVAGETGAPCIGFVGLNVPSFEAPFMPCVEIGWRLARAAWGRGYAPEAARTVRDFAFDTVGFAEIVSFTAVENRASRRVMEKIGMHHDPSADFDHPNVPAGSPLVPHVLYRLRVEERPPVGS